MKYAHVMRYVTGSIWAIETSKMEELLEVLAFRASGRAFTAEEIQARIGSPTPPSSARRGSIAVLSLRGVIAHRMGSMAESSGGMSAELFTKMFSQLAADESVGSIVLDVDSPGGTIGGVMEAADMVYAARRSKRIVAVANATMASAAYWIACQAHEIVAIPSAMDACIGSIGVFTCHEDLSAKLEKEGVKVSLISAGKQKAQLNPFTPLRADQRAKIQAGVDAVYAKFVDAVARGRGVSAAEVRDGYGEGASLSAQDALDAGLIDKISTMDETIARLASGQAQPVGRFRGVSESPALSASSGEPHAALKPERFMGDPQGQEDTEVMLEGCPDCDPDCPCEALECSTDCPTCSRQCGCYVAQRAKAEATAQTVRAEQDAVAIALALTE